MKTIYHRDEGDKGNKEYFRKMKILFSGGNG